MSLDEYRPKAVRELYPTSSEDLKTNTIITPETLASAVKSSDEILKTIAESIISMPNKTWLQFKQEIAAVSPKENLNTLLLWALRRTLKSDLESLAAVERALTTQLED